MKGVREAPSKALVGELAARSGDSPAAAFSVRQVRQGRGGGGAEGQRANLRRGISRKGSCRAMWFPPWAAPPESMASPRRPACSHPPPLQALSTLGMLVGTTAAGLAFAASGRSYELTFALSAVASVLALLLVVVAFGRDASVGAAERGGWRGGAWWGGVERLGWGRDSRAAHAAPHDAAP